jgi:hypothetical protein
MTIYRCSTYTIPLEIHSTIGELMTGTEAPAFDVKRNMDRLPDFLNPETQLAFSGKLDGK